MEIKIKNIVCNEASSCLTGLTETFIERCIKDGWSLKVIQDSLIIALQNKLQEHNY